MKKVMAICICMFVSGLIGLYLCFYFEESKTQYLDLPEEIQAASKGDTMVLYKEDSSNTMFLYYYHKRTCPAIPKNAQLLIVK